MKVKLVLVVAMLSMAMFGGGMQAAHAAVPTFYSVSGDFDNAVGVLPTEGFENGSAPDGGFMFCNATERWDVPSACFGAGTLSQGLGFAGSLVDVGADYIPGTGPSSRWLAANGGPLEIDFDAPGVAAASMKMVGFETFLTPFTVDVYGASGLIGSAPGTQTRTGTFFGVTSAEPITKIVLVGASIAGIDDLGFGTPTDIVAHPVILDTAGPALNLDLTATLSELLTGAPLAGQTVDFSANGNPEGSVTSGAGGDAACGCPAAIVDAALAGGYSASFDGAYPYVGSLDGGALIA